MIKEMESLLVHDSDVLWKRITKDTCLNNKGQVEDIYRVNPVGYDCGFFFSTNRSRAEDFKHKLYKDISEKYKNVPWC